MVAELRRRHADEEARAFTAAKASPKAPTIADAADDLLDIEHHVADDDAGAAAAFSSVVENMPPRCHRRRASESRRASSRLQVIVMRLRDVDKTERDAVWHSAGRPCPNSTR